MSGFARHQQSPSNNNNNVVTNSPSTKNPRKRNQTMILAAEFLNESNSILLFIINCVMSLSLFHENKNNDR